MKPIWTWGIQQDCIQQWDKTDYYYYMYVCVCATIGLLMFHANHLPNGFIKFSIKYYISTKDQKVEWQKLKGSINKGNFKKGKPVKKTCHRL